MPTFKIVSFDKLRELPGVEYIVPVQGLAEPRPFNGTVLEDIPSDAVMLQDALILGCGVIYRDSFICADIHYTPNRWENAPWRPGDVQGDTIHIPDITPVAQVEGPVFYTDHFVGRSNFGHFVHDTLTAAPIFKFARLGNPELRLLFARIRFESQRSLLRTVFGVSDEDVISIETRPAHVGLLVLPRRQAVLGYGGKWAISYGGLSHIASAMRRKLIPSSSASSKLFLHRFQKPVSELSKLEVNTLQGRNFSNLADLASFMLDRGYIGFEPAKLPVEAVASFVGASDVIVGMHGAGLANFIFAQEVTKVFELVSSTGSWLSLQAMAVARNMEFTRVVCNPNSSAANWCIDFGHLAMRLP